MEERKPKRRGWIGVLVVLAVLVGLLFYTNLKVNNVQQYSAWVAGEAYKRIDSKEAQQYLREMGAREIERYTEVKNYYLFSCYETAFQGSEIKAVGLVGIYVPYAISIGSY